MDEITRMAGIEVWTVQMAQWRKAKAAGITLIDTTVKSGDKTFAPSWDMVMTIKAATPENRVAAEETYTHQYRELMRTSWRQNPAAWKALLAHEKIAVACYCTAGVFCHRHPLVDFLEAVAKWEGIPFTRRGEL